MTQSMDEQFPKLYARLKKIKQDEIPQGYLGNIGIFGQEIACYDEIFSETVESLDIALTILKNMGLAEIIDKDGPNDYRNGLDCQLEGLTRGKGDYVRTNTDFQRWSHCNPDQGRNFDVHFLMDPAVNSVFYFITYSEKFNQEVKDLQLSN